jgi:hypothetical protein
VIIVSREKVLSDVKKALKRSELVKSITALKKEKKKPLPLTSEQIATLQRNGNTSSNWGKVRAIRGFNPERINNSSFHGTIVLGRFTKDVAIDDGIGFPAGIYNSTVINATIEDDALVSEVKLLANYVVKKGSILFNCGTVTCKEKASFGNGRELPIAIETGGREVKTFADITVDIAATVATSRIEKQFLQKYESLVEQFVKKVTSNRGIIEEGAVIMNTPEVRNTYVGQGAHIDNVRMVANTTILSNPDEATEISGGAYVKNAIIQWGCEVTSMAIVANSVLTEHSHVERHGKVTDSIVGANTGIAEGEVTACLVGPFVGFHHQALLIAAFWPEGKGNIGYGANVGSNHTSKAPDQELWPGEGTFFGLGVNVKFPSDFTKAPYSIIATGVSSLPQKLLFPFSLINAPAERFDGISPAYNEVMPGWVLSDNIFTVRRNEGKYKKRNKAKRSQIVFEVLRPEVVNLMLEAREKLEGVKLIKRVYTDKDIKGIGKNYLLESNRKKGVNAYTFYIRYYALLGLKRKLEEYLATRKKSKIKSLLTTATRDRRWEHERRILNVELKENGIADNLRLLAEMQGEVTRSVQVSKEKDDRRGAAVIEDYPEAHAPASEDSFVKQTHAETQKMHKEIEHLLKKIPKNI